MNTFIDFLIAKFDFLLKNLKKYSKIEKQNFNFNLNFNQIQLFHLLQFLGHLYCS
jgi:hypothetical protein